MKEFLREGVRTLLAQAGRLPGLRLKPFPVTFVVERNDWSIRWDGLYITRGIDAVRPGTACISESPWRAAGAVVHFGSHFLWNAWSAHLPRGPAYVVTYFHGKPEDGPDAARDVEAFLARLDRVACVVTAASLMERRLVEWGVPKERVVRIPIGVDTHHFAPADANRRAAARAAFGIPENAIAVGSFQKDGVGWGDGNEPKLIKGPDIFVAAMAALRARGLPVMALLTGPARGYVKAGLAAAGVPVRHVFLDDYLKIADAYAALDLYLMTSREEGGPKAIPESFAAGVPIVAADCGMASDMIRDGINGALVPVGDVGAFAARAAAVLVDPACGRAWTAAARADIAAYDWSAVAAAHWEKVYAPLLGP